MRTDAGHSRHSDPCVSVGLTPKRGELSHLSLGPATDTLQVEFRHRRVGRRPFSDYL